jgi:hypothetical protein
MELQDQIEKYCATKVELMAFREEVAVQFDGVHAAIANIRIALPDLNAKLDSMESKLIKCCVAVIILHAMVSLAIARYLS